MMFGRGYNGSGRCFEHGFGYMHNGFSMFIAGILVVVAVVVLILIVKKAKSRKIQNDALETLKLRFVKGEITEEEFTRRKNILTSK